MFPKEEDLQSFIWSGREHIERFRGLSGFTPQAVLDSGPRVDILCRKAASNQFVAIELKVAQPDDRSVGQVQSASPIWLDMPKTTDSTLRTSLSYRGNRIGQFESGWRAMRTPAGLRLSTFFTQSRPRCCLIHRLRFACRADSNTTYRVDRWGDRLTDRRPHIRGHRDGL